MNLARWLDATARRCPARTAIAHGRAPWCDYAGFAAMAARTAGWWAAEGLSPGDRLALFLPNRPAYLPLLWGTWWAGGCAVPVNAKLHPKEAAWIVQHSGARRVFTDAIQAEALRAALADAGCSAVVCTDTGFLHDDALPRPAPAERGEHDPAWLFYTSGTTGRPKGVTLAARQLRWMTMGYFAAIQAVEPGDAMLHAAPLSHGSGLYHLPYVLNGGVNVVPASEGFDAAECLALAAHWGRTGSFMAPTMVRRLVDAVRAAGTGRPEGFSTIVYGGGPMYLADLEDALDTLGPRFAQIYGQGESPMTITVLPRAVIADTTHPRRRERLASVGSAQAMVELRVCDEAGRPLPAGTPGEVCVRGETVMEGYWRDPAATAAAVRDGWLATGDIGRLDDDGFLTLLDRSKDLVVSGGSNIYPREVEEVLLAHPQVAAAAVIGRPDAEWGEVVVAFVVARGPLDAAALDAHCLQHIARFKRPKHYRFVAALPQNPYGKVPKTALRALDAEADAPSASSPTTTGESR